jgi:hypothetical protein
VDVTDVAGGDKRVSYPMIGMTHPSRNFFVLSLFCVFMQVCKATGAGLGEFS